MTDKYYVIETIYGYLEGVDGIVLRSCRLLYNKSVKRFKSIEKAKAFIESSNSKYLTKQYGVRIIPVSRTSKRANNETDYDL